MLIFLQEIVMQLFLWLLQLIDGIMEIFSAISGITTVTYHGEQVNLLDGLQAENESLFDVTLTVVRSL